MSEKLFSIIRNKVFKEKEIQEVSRNSQREVLPWLFDFKSQGLQKDFLEEFSSCFWNLFSSEEFSTIQIGGMESGALPLIAGVSLLVPKNKNINSFFIRKSRKKAGLSNLIEGDIDKDMPIVLIDDIINVGSTFRKQIVILEEMGYKVKAIFACIRFRDIEAYKDLTDKGIQIKSIFELNDFKDVLPVENIVDSPLENEYFGRYANSYKLTLTTRPSLYKVTPKAGPILVGDYIYIASSDGVFFCLRKVDGSIVWQYKLTFGTDGRYVISTPVVYKDSVMFGGYDGNFYCLNRFTGERQWIFFEADWVGSSPCVDEKNGVVFVTLEFGLFLKKGGVVAIDISSGKVIWRDYSMVDYGHSSPVYNKKFGMLFCGCNDGYMYAYDAKNGKVIWKYKTNGAIKYGIIFDEKRSLVCFGNMDAKVYALNYKDGSLYHCFEAVFGFYSTPALDGDNLIIGSLDKFIYCFSLKDKNVVWKHETSGRIFASPIVFGKSVFIGSNNGRLYELDTKTGKTINLIQFSERIVNRICIELVQDSDTKKILYVPTFTCELYKMIEK